MANNTNKLEKPSKLFSTPKTYRWAPNSKEEYLKAFCQPKVGCLIETFLSNTFPHNKDGIDHAVESLNNIFHYLATISNLKFNKKVHKNKQNKEKWFDQDCKIMRNKRRFLSNQKHRQPDESDVRLSYYEQLKQYKNTLRKKKEQFTKKQLETIEESLDSNNFWNTLNKKQHEEHAEWRDMERSL